MHKTGILPGQLGVRPGCPRGVGNRRATAQVAGTRPRSTNSRQCALDVAGSVAAEQRPSSDRLDPRAGSCTGSVCAARST